MYMAGQRIRLTSLFTNVSYSYLYYSHSLSLNSLQFLQPLTHSLPDIHTCRYHQCVLTFTLIHFVGGLSLLPGIINMYIHICMYVWLWLFICHKALIPCQPLIHFNSSSDQLCCFYFYVRFCTRLLHESYVSF